uniref:Uncharacterized protein n=1 Tax=Trichuris muris TaxID=70415 RepID=A0A5S6QYC2_TRIMR
MEIPQSPCLVLSVTENHLGKGQQNVGNRGRREIAQIICAKEIALMATLLQKQKNRYSAEDGTKGGPKNYAYNNPPLNGCSCRPWIQ